VEEDPKDVLRVDDEGLLTQTIHRLLISNLLVVSNHDDTLASKKKDVIRCNYVSW
jgi:hypothetical protein